MERQTHRHTRHFNFMLVLLAIGAVVLALAAIDPMAWAAQYRGRDHAGHHDGSRVLAGICTDEFEGRVRGLSGYVAGWLELNAAQRAAWSRVEAALGDGMTTMRGLCDDMPATAAGATAPGRLARAEALMEAATNVVRTVRPAFDDFYATLDGTQRLRFDEAAAHRGGRR